MRRYVTTRLLFAIPTVLGALAIVFFIIRAIPGDPVLVMLGESATPAQIAAYRAAKGLDSPILVQLGRTLLDFLHGDFGTSITSNRPVLDIILERLPSTLELAASGVLVALVCGVSLGVVAALTKGSPLDTAILGCSTVFMSMPAFFTGLIIVMVFGVTLKVIPVISLNLQPGQHLLGLLGPAATLGLGTSGGIARTARNAMLRAMGEDYVKTARSKGLSFLEVLFRHELANASIPIVTVVGGMFAGYVGGAVVTESVFSRPGIGKLLVDAINARDYAVIQGTTVFLACFMIAVTLAVDLLYGAIDPRIRLHRAEP
jgi:ABC-type dipeptide/oligopeptide/nickel transport system permease component